MSELDLLARAKVPMAFIGGPLNLKPLPAGLLDLKEYEAIDPETRDRIVYVKVVYRQPRRPNEDFIFYIDKSSISLDQADEIIKTKYFK